MPNHANTVEYQLFALSTHLLFIFCSTFPVLPIKLNQEKQFEDSSSAVAYY